VFLTLPLCVQRVQGFDAQKGNQVPHKSNGTFRAAMRSMFQSGPRYNTPLPYNPNAPQWFAAGPVFNPGAAAAILRNKKSRTGPQTLQGYAYRVAFPQKYNALQPTSLFAPKGVPTVGYNIQTGMLGVYTPAVNDDGSFVTDEGFFAQESGAQIA
jgi:hypothetical protein